MKNLPVPIQRGAQRCEENARRCTHTYTHIDTGHAHATSRIQVAFLWRWQCESGRIPPPVAAPDRINQSLTYIPPYPHTYRCPALTEFAYCLRKARYLISQVSLHPSENRRVIKRKILFIPLLPNPNILIHVFGIT